MAKSRKTASGAKKAASRLKVVKPILVKADLVAVPTSLSKPANVQVTFFSGLGQATVALFRKGNMINMQTTSITATITFSDVQAGDIIAVNGVATGSATIGIDVPTNPGTPTQFGAGFFNIIYNVL